ncbi:MAG: hypothetical protein IPG49_07725 [Proteobacteria bacterium]|nr:hypothetical protein [Pseudomonadota bacterium]
MASTSLHGHDWARLKAVRDAYVLRLNGIYESNLAEEQGDAAAGLGSLVDAHTRDGGRYATHR